MQDHSDNEMQQSPSSQAPGRLIKECGFTLHEINEMSAEEIQLKFYELLEHRTELERQNQALVQDRERLKRSCAHYYELYDKAPTGYVTISTRGRILEANQASAYLLGMNREDLTGLRFSGFIYAKDHKIFLQHRKELYRSRLMGTVKTCELRVAKPGGTFFWACLEAAAIRHIDGSIVCRVVINDIDERKRAEEKLYQAQEQFRIMADGCPFMIWVCDHKGCLIFANSTHLDFFGTSLEEVQGKKWQPLLHPDDQDAYTRKFMKALRERRSFAATARVQRHDGQWRWIMSRGEPEFSASGEFLGMVGSSPDITEMVESRQETERVNHLLQQALSERDKFFSIIAHDLKSPFIGFLSFIRLLNEKFEKFSLEEIKNMSMQMKHSAENLYSLLENLLEWSVLKRDAAEYNPGLCCLSDVVNENIQLVHHLAALKDISFQNSISDGMQVFGDKTMLKMVLRNLFTNAVKFSPPGGRVFVKAEPMESLVRISVADEGIGMNQETIKKMFSIQHASSRKGTSGEKGTGLGLLLCKEYTEKNRGEIWAESAPGKGTVFYLTLPVTNLEDSTRRAASD
ncbi:PAS domain-containing sensor histidine kinase [Desulfonatronovibrio magnus]|uniref:PAS domain-containing sensor histidine kinase n=1 Tax=Desulfonatronovibrio magnus TaxID=698827 RepID=UPI0005EB44B9|nr:PAS domain-containing sensor histidine kinase [Desulfonatronovibrio magnus]